MKRLHRMPGASLDRARACKVSELEPHATKGSEGCSGISGTGSRRRASCRDEHGLSKEMGSVARFPKLDECAHFHYEHVELGQLEVSMAEAGEPDSFTVRVTSGDACWTLQRSHEELLMLDQQLHRCIFDREFSMLPDLQEEPAGPASETLDRLRGYLRRFSELSHEGLNCGPVLNWLQLDNRGRRILVPEADSCPINTPAVAAAYAVRPYRAQAQDELSFQVGDMISVIDMPPAGESSWWRGKLGFAVGFFPAECVSVFGDKLPRRLALATSGQQQSHFHGHHHHHHHHQHQHQHQHQHDRLQPGRLQPVKPVLRKHGKLIAFFRSFILNRPSRRRLKQSGILRERVFGCDLGEHLLNSGREVPCVLSCCAEFIERHGLVDGIYRLSGVASNIQRLRHAFDEDRPPALQTDGGIRQDIHSVASLLKMYFRELPNPLCTYQLYGAFVGAVRPAAEAERLRRMREAVRELPPPHYRTLEYLVRHLERVAARGEDTGMTARNLAIVWAPNLLRSKELELAGVAALQGVGVQAVVTEFLIRYAELVFAAAGQRPKSLAVAAGSKRLLSLEEARNRSVPAESTLLEVGTGSAGLSARYHTIIELPPGGQQRRRGGSKRSPSLNWRALFGGRQTAKARAAPEPRLRPVKSADSLEGLPEDGLGPLPIGPTGTRPCGHSRSVSHDSYFEQLGEQPNEIAGLDGVVPGVAGAAGSRRKRSRLEERLQCEAELRFIDSQSPDQVMLSADVHEMESPSPLPTPGYLPLLSEGSTPITPTKAATAPLEPLDQEMRPCERLVGGTSIAEFHRLDCIPNISKKHLREDQQGRKGETDGGGLRIQGMMGGNPNLCSSQSMTDLDSLMTCEQTYQHSSNSNFIPLDPREKVTSFGPTSNYPGDLRNADKWFIADLTLGTISPSNSTADGQLHRLPVTKTPQMLAVEECSSGSSTPKSCHESMCYSVSEGAYGNEARDSSFRGGTCEDGRASSTQRTRADDAEQVAHADMLNLVSKPDLMDNQSSCRGTGSRQQPTSNVKNVITDYQSDGSSLASWKPLLQQSGRERECDNNQNKGGEGTVEPEQNDRLFGKTKYDNARAISLSLENSQVNVGGGNEEAPEEAKKEGQKNRDEPSVIGSPGRNNKSNPCSSRSDYGSSKCSNQQAGGTPSSSSRAAAIQDDVDVVVPSESAAVEPEEMAHVPEILTGSVRLEGPAASEPTSSCNRLSGGDRVEAVPIRRRYDSDMVRDRRSFDSEIGREIVREHKMKQELENARGKFDETLAASSHNQSVPATHLPPCLRARHARATRAALSRSLDEAKFNKMTSSVDGSGGPGMGEQRAQIKSDTPLQHSSTPNVGSSSSSSSSGGCGGSGSGKPSSQAGPGAERSMQSLNKNLGLDLDDPRCRERIEKYKEERRTFLRDKYRSESFRAARVGQSPPASQVPSNNKDDGGEQALLARLKQRASRPPSVL